jgi:hypothetical protein
VSRGGFSGDNTKLTGGFSSNSRLDSTAPTILKSEGSLATEQATTETYGSEKKTLEGSPGTIIYNRSGLVGFNKAQASLTVQKSPAIRGSTVEGRDIKQIA